MASSGRCIDAADVRFPTRRSAASTRPARLVAEDSVGWLRASVSGRGLPQPEPTGRRTATRALAVSALAVTTAYLTWRTIATLDLASWWTSIPFLVLEIHAAIGLLLMTIGLWDIDSRPSAAPVMATSRRVAALIPTLDESLDVLSPTIAAARAMRVEHETWVLDDGARPEVARLAADLGARYLARTDGADGLAGNLNAALATIQPDVAVILHADSVAAPDLLVNTLGYLDDPRVALVQTPEGFYNTDSFEHAARGGNRPIHERTMIHRLWQPGRNRWHAALWTGTGAVLRVAALDDAGGVATATLAPELHTSIRLHRRGWRTVAHNEVLARGLAPATAAIELVQRHRRVLGVMQVLRVENPLTASGLNGGQRLSYAAELLNWFDAWRWLAMLVLPIAVLLTGAAPVATDLVPFAIAFAFTYGMQAAARYALGRGCRRPWLATLLGIVRMTPDLDATHQLLHRGAAMAAARASLAALPGATPKGRTNTSRQKRSEPRLLRFLALVGVYAAAWFGLAIMVSIATGTILPWSMDAAFAWLILDVLALARATGRVRELRFGGERRASVRFETSFAGVFDGRPCDILDLSLRGAGIRLTGQVIGHGHRLAIWADGREIDLAVAVRSTRSDGPHSTIVGLEFAPDQNIERAELAVALFRTTVVPATAERPLGRRVVADPARPATRPAAA